MTEPSPPMLPYALPDAILRAVHRPRYVMLAGWTMLIAIASLLLPLILLPFALQLACLALWTPLAGYVALVQYASVWRMRTDAADAAVVMSGVIAFFTLLPALVGIMVSIDDPASIVMFLPLLVVSLASLCNTAASYAWWRVLAARDELM